MSLWADDLVRKLSERNYALLRQSAVKSRNGIPGTRFDFAYTPPGTDNGERFYTAVLFVTDEWRVIVQLAGKVELEASHQKDLDQILAKIRVTGCKVGSKVCKSVQPRSFETAEPATGSPARPNNDGSAAKAEPEPEPAPEPEPEPEPAPEPAPE